MSREKGATRGSPFKMKGFSLAAMILLATAALGLGLPAFDSFMRVRMAKLRDNIIQGLEKSLECEIRYDSISPSFLRALEFRGLSLHDGSGEEFLSVSRLSVFYRLDRLIAGGGQGMLSRAEVIGLRVKVDRASEGGVTSLIERLSRLQGEGGPLSLPESFRLSFRDLSVEYRDRDLFGQVEGADAEFLLDSGGMELSSKLPLRVRGRGLPDTRMTAHVSGSSVKDFSAFRFTVDASANSADFSLKRQKLLLSFRNGVYDLRKVADRSPLDVVARLDSMTGDFKIDLDFVRFKPSAFGSLRGRLANFSPLRDIAFSGSGSVEGNLHAPSYALDYGMEAVAALPESILPERAQVDLKMKGNWKALAVERLNFRSGDGQVLCSGGYDLLAGLAFGDLDSDFSWRDLMLKGSAQLRSVGGGRNHTIFSDSFLVGEHELLSLALQILPGDDKVDLGLEGFVAAREVGQELGKEDFSELEAIPSGSPSRFELSGSWYSGKQSFLELNASLSRLPGSLLADLAEPFSALGKDTLSLADGFSLSADAWFQTDFHKLAYSLPEIILSRDGSPGSYAVASLSGSAGTLTLDRVSAFWPGHRLQASLYADYADPQEIHVDGDVDVDGTGYSLTGMILGQRRFSFSGDHGLSLTGRLEGGQAVFALSMASFPIPLGKFIPRLSLEAKGRFRSMDDWFVETSSSRLEQGAGLLPSYAEIGFAGEFDQDGGRLTNISLKDEHSTIYGSADLAWTLSRPLSASVNLSLGAEGGGESYSLGAAISGNEVWGRLDLAGLPIARFVGSSLGGKLSGEAALSGSLSDPRLSFKIGVEKGDFMELPLDLKLSGEYGEGKVTVAALTGNLWILSLLQGRARYDLRSGASDLTATLRVTLGQSVLDTDLLVSGDIPVNGRGALSLEGRASDIKIAGYEARSWPLSLKNEGGIWSFRAGDREQLQASMARGGDFSLVFAEPLGIRGKMAGIIKDGEIEASVPDLFIDMPVLWRIFGQDFLEFPSGTIDASLYATGNLRDPELSGKAMARNMAIRLPDFLKDNYGPVDLPLEMTNSRLQARGISISGGGGTVLTDLAIDFERWLPQQVMVDSRTAPDKPVRVDMVVGNIDAEGSAEGRLMVSVTPLQLEILGSFEASDSTITLASAREDEEPSDWPILASIGVSVGRKVEFVWPSRQVPWLRSYLEPGSKLQVGLDGRTGDFSLKGDAKLRGGEVFYFRRSFYVREGLMTFNENEDSFDPFITIRADMRDQDEKGPVLITMQAEKNRLSAFRPMLSSSPPKTEDEILALLGQSAIGGTAQDGQAAVTEGLVSAAGDALAQFTGIRFFENTVRDTFNLDLFSVRSQLLQNVVLGAALADSSYGGTSLGNESSPGVYFDNTTIMAGKYLGSDLFLQGTMRMQNDPDAYLGNLDVDLEFSIEWNTPFFRIMWDFFPQNAENLFVNDQSLGVFWELEY